MSGLKPQLQDWYWDSVTWAEEEQEIAGGVSFEEFKAFVSLWIKRGNDPVELVNKIGYRYDKILNTIECRESNGGDCCFDCECFKRKNVEGRYPALCVRYNVVVPHDFTCKYFKECAEYILLSRKIAQKNRQKKKVKNGV